MHKHLSLFLAASLVPSALLAQASNSKSDEYLAFNYGKATGGDEWVQSIKVIQPAYRADIRGNVTINFEAPGMKVAKALCWQQPTTANQNPAGHDQSLTSNDLVLGADGKASFVFPADNFPNGPLTVRILARNDAGKRDICELQLFNLGGVKWDQGIPAEAPPGSKGLKLVFSDDFNGPLSISNDGRGATYGAHKPGGGDFSGWQFSNLLGDGKPFSQVGTWLKIAARKDAESPKGRSGLISSVSQEGKGIWAKPPCYLECRFLAQSAPGTWPAFWTLSPFPGAGDELDIVEEYGGMGKKNPNSDGYYTTSHFWGQTNADGSKKKPITTRVPIMNLGSKSYWSTTFHTYGLFIGLQETVYYFDNIEVSRHPTNEVSRNNPAYFLINYAIGGISGWPIDMERYGNGSDMYVDYVRVYAEAPFPRDERPVLKPATTVAATPTPTASH